MVAAAAQPQQQQPPPPTSAEEEALKRNTDCVYFLASPLTCKKGSECEYRHSEYARVNPRDCYFWLHGNCLNPKCGFRHPPLDGLLGTQTAVPSGPSFPSLHPAATPATSAAHAQNSGKQTVPCIFFQKGLCLKGDRCAFLHGPNPTASKAPQQSTTAHSNEPPSTKKVFGVLQKCTQEQKVTPANVSKAVVLHPEASKPVPRTEAALPRTTAGLEKKVPPSLATNDELPRYKATNVPPVINGNSLSRSSHLHQVHALDEQGFQHGKDAEEFMRESSPGFDVLVDDELGETDYYHDEDQYGRTRGHDGRNLNSVGEYDIGHSIDYNSLADIDRETFRDPRGHDSYDHVQGQYAWEQHKASSDRALVVSSHPERRSYSKAGSPDPINGSDLRYRLSKQRKGNVLRSVVSLDYAPDNQVEERSHRSTSRRDALSSHESSLSGRLRGRIKLPRRSPVSGNDLRSEREGDRGRNWGPLSPGKSQTSRQGRLRDRIRGRVEEDDNNGGRNLRVSQMRRERIDDGSIDFAGPKRLAELKVGKSTENKEQQFLGKRKGIEDHQQREGDLSFEGPMPLSEILKRKRKSGGAASSELSSITKGEYNQKESKESLVGGSNNTADVAKQGAVSIVSREEVNSEEEVKSAKADAVGAAEDKTEVSQLPNGSGVKAEDGMIGDETMEDHELEGDDHRDGDYEYEQGDEGEYNYEEGENADPEDEYLDDEDGDDFAKKIGVMFS